MSSTYMSYRIFVRNLFPAKIFLAGRHFAVAHVTIIRKERSLRPFAGLPSKIHSAKVTVLSKEVSVQLLRLQFTDVSLKYFEIWKLARKPGLKANQKQTGLIVATYMVHRARQIRGPRSARGFALSC